MSIATANTGRFIPRMGESRFSRREKPPKEQPPKEIRSTVPPSRSSSGWMTSRPPTPTHDPFAGGVPETPPDRTPFTDLDPGTVAGYAKAVGVKKKQPPPPPVAAVPVPDYTSFSQFHGGMPKEAVRRGFPKNLIYYNRLVPEPGVLSPAETDILSVAHYRLGGKRGTAKGGKAWNKDFGRRAVEEMTLLSEATVRRGLDSLAGMGFVDRKDGCGRDGTVLYRCRDLTADPRIKRKPVFGKHREISGEGPEVLPVYSLFVPVRGSRSAVTDNRIFWLLYFRCDKRTGKVADGGTGLAKMAGTSRRTLIDSLARLESRRLIRWRGRGGEVLPFTCDPTSQV